MHHSSIHDIRIRLLTLLVRAFALVLFLSLFFFLPSLVIFFHRHHRTSPHPFLLFKDITSDMEVGKASPRRLKRMRH